MDVITNFVAENAPHAHYIVFGCLMLAGLNFPVSEDLLLIVSGALASTLVPENVVQLFIWAFMGAYVSDWVAYWLGRRLGTALFQTHLLKGRATRRRIQRIERFYAKYGGLTLFFGRFIPFGVRNCLFMTAGMGRMPFGRFVLIDGVACLLSNSVFFSLGYYFGKNHRILQNYLHTYHFFLFAVVLCIGVVLVTQGVWRRRARNRVAENDNSL